MRRFPNTTFEITIVHGPTLPPGLADAFSPITEEMNRRAALRNEKILRQKLPYREYAFQRYMETCLAGAWSRVRKDVERASQVYPKPRPSDRKTQPSKRRKDR